MEIRYEKNVTITLDGDDANSLSWILSYAISALRKSKETIHDEEDAMENESMLGLAQCIHSELRYKVDSGWFRG